MEALNIITTAIKLSQTFSQELGKGLATITAFLVGMIFIFLLSAGLLLILLIIIMLRKFVFVKSKTYKWAARMISLLVCMIALSLLTNVISLTTNSAGLAIIPAIPLILGIYCVFRLK